MTDEQTYCDNCGDPLPEGKGRVYAELPFDVESANAGESGIICAVCDEDKRRLAGLPFDVERVTGSSHTPGPWQFDGDPVADVLADGQVICQMGRYHDDDVIEANARLIAAAPDLLAALKALISTARTFSDEVPEDEKMWTSIDDLAMTQAFDAVRKAVGDDG